MIKTTVGIVTWNSIGKIDLLLESFFRFHDGDQYKIIVSDNGSEDGTVEMIRDRFPQVAVIENHENLGVAKARNKTLRQREGNYTALLDDDLEFHDAALETLSERLEAFPDVAVSSPKLLYPDGGLQLSCRTFQTIAPIIMRGSVLGKYFPDSKIIRKHLMMDTDHDKEQFVDWTLGACHLIRNTHLDQIGELDEKYFYLYEDVDFCFRAKKNGLKVLYVPSTIVTHHYRRKSARSFNKMTTFHIRSILRYFWKHRNLF